MALTANFINEQIQRIHIAVHSGSVDLPTIDDALSELSKVAQAIEKVGADAGEIEADVQAADAPAQPEALAGATG